jgi:hypothetical protein
MKSLKTYPFIVILVLAVACSERIVVSDADALGLRFKVKSMDESLYIAYNSFDNIVLDKKIYHHRYQFHYDSRYKSVEKNFYYNKSPHDSTFIQPTVNTPQSDFSLNRFPSSFKEPEYCLADYQYIADSLTVVDFRDTAGNLLHYISKKYANNRLQSEERYTGSGKLITKSRFWYNSKNQLINKTVFYENDYRETHYSYSAGEKFETGGEFNCRYRFDINSRVSSKKTYRGTTLLSETKLYYNDYGDLATTREIDASGATRTTLYEYSYDSNRNWTVCVEYNYTGNIFVRKREITYYS